VNRERLKRVERLTTLSHEAESKEFGTFPPVPELRIKPEWARRTARSGTKRVRGERFSRAMSDAMRILSKRF
jgi:hypothetical protein